MHLMLRVTHKKFLPTICFMAHMNTHALTAPRLLWFDLTHDQSALDCTVAFTSA